MTNSTSPRPTSPLTRRHYPHRSPGSGGPSRLGACGSGSGNVPGEAPAASGRGATGYSGPKVSLEFWNGFTGGDGPYMKKLVDQFNAEHPNIASA